MDFVKGFWILSFIVLVSLPGYSEQNEAVLLRIKNKDNRWGYIDKMGTEVIKAKFEIAFDFSEGLARVNTGGPIIGKWFYIDTTGTHAMKRTFDGAGDFAEGLAPVKTGEKWGFINKAGTVVLEPQFDNASSFSEELAAIEVDGKWGFINRN